VKAALLITLLILPFCGNAQKLKNLRTSTDSTYGFTLKNPVLIGQKTVQKAEIAVYNYLNGIKRLNGETLIVKSRTSVTNPKYKKHEQQEMLKKMKAGEQVGLFIDMYKLEGMFTNDTFTLYIDTYNEGDTKVPIGMVWSN
jgi:hypothetical protein